MSTSSPASPGKTGPLVDSEFDKLWNQAIKKYEDEPGNTLVSSDEIRNMRKSQVSAVVEAYARDFRQFRKRGGKTKDVLSSTVDMLLSLADPAADALSTVVPGAGFVIVGITALLQAVGKISELYDTVESVLDQIDQEFTRIGVYHTIPCVSDELSKAFISSFSAIIDLLQIVSSYCHKHVQAPLKHRAKDFFKVLTRSHPGLRGKVEELQRLRDAQLHLTVAGTYINVQGVQASVADITARMDVIMATNEFKELKDQFPFGNASLHTELLEAKHGDTCEWIMKEASFKEWKGGDNSVYAVLGPAGCGKTTACALIIDRLREELRNQDIKEPPPFTLAYYIFRATTNRDNTCLALMNSLVYQIAQASPDGWKLLKEECARPGSKGPWTHKQLFAILQRMLKVVGPIIIVIDALDECFSADPRSSGTQGRMLEFLRDLHNLSLPTLRFLVTSRPEPSILQTLRQFHRAELLLSETKEHRADIAAYVEAHLPKTEPWNDDMRERATLALTDLQKSHGMFLWVVLQIRYLDRLMTPDEVNEALDTLPEGLEQTYRGILQRFGCTTPDVQLVLGFIAFALRSLTVDDVFAALSFDHKRAKIKCFGVDDKEDFIRLRLPGVIEIVDSDSKRVVRFIHFSVKEYLTNKNLRHNETMGRYYLNRDFIDIFIATLLLAALEPQNRDALESLFDYATQHWHKHVPIDVIAGNVKPNTPVHPSPEKRQEAAEGLNSALTTFLHPASPAFESWKAYHGWAFADMPLHCAVHLGLPDLVTRLIERGADCNAFSDVQTPLHYAARHNANSCMEVLLKHGADPNLSQGDGFMPLHVAALCGHAAAMHTLLNAGADIRAQTTLHFMNTPIGATSLHMAVQRRHNDICGLLLRWETADRLADIPDWTGRTPLHYAAQRDDPSTLEILLGGETNAYTHDAFGETPLSLARDRGRDQLVKLLEGHPMRIARSDESPRNHMVIRDPFPPRSTSNFTLHALLKLNSSPAYKPTQPYTIESLVTMGWLCDLESVHNDCMLNVTWSSNDNGSGSVLCIAKLYGIDTDGSSWLIISDKYTRWEGRPFSPSRETQPDCGKTVACALRAESGQKNTGQTVPRLLVHLKHVGEISSHTPISFPLPLPQASCNEWTAHGKGHKLNAYILQQLATAAMHFQSCRQITLDKSQEQVTVTEPTSSNAKAEGDAQVQQALSSAGASAIQGRNSAGPIERITAPYALSTLILTMQSIFVVVAAIYATLFTESLVRHTSAAHTEDM